MKKYTPIFLLALLLSYSEASAVARAWVGIGSGGLGTNFNAAANWSPAGVPTAADALTISMTAGGINAISLSASITVGSLDMSVSGNRNGYLRANGFVLTVNGTASFNAVNYVSPVNYSFCEIDAGNAPGGFVFNGATAIHTTGSGDTYIGGATLAEGSMTFNANLTMGTWAYTNPGDEPIWNFNAAGAQTVTYASARHIKPSTINFGTTNSPSVTVVAVAPGSAPGNWFTVYDGSLNVNNATIADIGDFDFDPWTAVCPIAINGTSTLRIGNDNNFPGFAAAVNYTSYTISSVSRVTYYGGLAQSVSNLPNPGYGHILFSGAGTKTSAGSFSIRGNWNNNSTFVHASSTHTFNGTPSQSIGGTVATIFYNLVENKATGSLLMGINNNRVNNVLTLTAGPLDLSGFTLIIGNAATAAVVRTAGYIISETNVAANPSIVQWMMGVTTGAFVFPFGTATGTYIPFTFNKTTATSSTVNVALRPTAASANLPWSSSVTQMFSPILAQDGSDESVIDRWWDITCSAATTADLTFSYLGTENTLIVPYNTGNIGAQYWATAWLPNNANIGSAPAVLAGVGTVNAAGVSFAAGAFTPMVLSSLAAPLPVELVSFTGVCENNLATLNWSTASETNNSHFVVTRSDNGMAFRAVGEVIGRGTTSSMSHYTFEDAEPLTATTLYRLVQYDFNGAGKDYEPIQVTSCEDHLNTATAFGVENDIVVMLNSEYEADYVVSILDVQGRVIHSEKISAAEGSTKHVISTPEISTGIYLVQIQMPSGELEASKVFVPGTN